MLDNAVVDSLSSVGGNVKANGSVAQRLMATGFNVNALRTNDVLRKEEWIQFDQTVVKIARTRLVGVADLMNAGLTFTVPNPLGTTRIEWEKEGDMSGADVSMSGVTEGSNDRLTWDLTSVPLPIIHKDFRINVRALEASRKFGESLDTTSAARASRLVSEKIEAILFLGSSVNGTNVPVYGYTTAPDRNTDSLIGDWSQSAQSGEEIVGDVLKMMAALQTDNMYGPYMLYVPRSYWNKLQDDFKANSDRTILERILAIKGVSGVNMSANLLDGAAGQVLLVQMTSDVVDMADGLQPTTVQWDSNGGMTINFKVLAIMVPRMKSDASTQSGIAHFSV